MFVEDEGSINIILGRESLREVVFNGLGWAPGLQAGFYDLESTLFSQGNYGVGGIFRFDTISATIVILFTSLN